MKKNLFDTLKKKSSDTLDQNVVCNQISSDADKQSVSFKQKKKFADVEKQRLMDETELVLGRIDTIEKLKKQHPLTSFIVFFEKTFNINICATGFVLLLWYFTYDDLNNVGIYTESVSLTFCILSGLFAIMACLSIILPDEYKWGEILYKRYLKENQKD